MSNCKFTLAQLADHLDAQMVGDANYTVECIAPLESAGKNALSFLANSKYEKALATSQAGIMLLAQDSAEKFNGNKLIVKNPYLCYAKLSELFNFRLDKKQGVHPSATVDADATVAADAYIGPNCVIEAGAVIGSGTQLGAGCFVGADTKLGNDCLLHANVTLYAGVELGNKVLIHSGTVIGSDGFGFAPSAEGWVKIHQLGGVVIGNNVEIGSNTSIDRGALDDTIIEDGVIIDNLVHIAHNVKIGAGSAIAGCVGIAGSAVIGKNCTVAGMVAINGHITIADNTHFHGGTIVTKGVKESGAYASAPPMQEVSKWRRNAVRYGQLDEWVEKIKALQKAQKD
ncbi:UDP-3-O-(3-hydroxymyristoyl)glucosamine N-acyltransferase [Saccharophagus degradans]|uniref:UDP-3-O-(3-hydroxymyristoyl)glucosamine N-acyltransferase n=1 Tax=Saccharophagus degradans TaxID=86304 RepID=UPI001C0A4A32|nr:UDP-3-O-(3-hydroxymyristoyl)glucosamine N-acyltransferase [Saccharophagus degradans]